MLQDVLTIHGRRFKDAALIVASPPCQEFSYMAMPWTRAKEKAAALRDGRDDPKRLTALFDACFRIQREASDAAGHHIPLVVENVCGAQKWVGRARWHYGSFYLWGDVPALMPITRKAIKVPTMGAGWYPPDHPKHVAGLAFNGHADRNLRAEGVKAGDRNKARASGGHEWTTGFDKHTKNDGGSWFNIAHNTTSGHGQNPVHQQISEGWRSKHYEDTAKMQLAGDGWFNKASGKSISRRTSSRSPARKAASAHIAKIPYELARHIARAWKPVTAQELTA